MDSRKSKSEDDDKVNGG